MMVVGVDPHKQSHTAVAVDELGRRQAAKTVKARREGHLQLLAWARGLATERLVWAVEDVRHVAGNLIRNHRRGGRRALRALTRVSTERSTGPDPADDVAARLDDERRMREVLGRLAMLRDAEQDAFVLCVWQGLSYREAAVALGVPVGTVRSRLSRARARLRLGTEQDEDASEASSAERDGSGVR